MFVMFYLGPSWGWLVGDENSFYFLSKVNQIMAIKQINNMILIMILIMLSILLRSKHLPL